MEDLIKKIIHTSMGAALLAKDKTKELIDELIENGKITEEEGKKFMNDLKNETNEKRSNMENEVKGIVERMMERMDIASRSELLKLEKRIQDLEQINQNN